MKTYSITLGVPDDFDPNQMDLSIDYPTDQLSIISEDFDDIKSIFKNVILEYPDVSDNKVVLFKYPKELALEAPEFPTFIKENLQFELGDNVTIIGVLDDIDFMVQNSAEAIATLKQMIDKINSKALIKLA